MVTIKDIAKNLGVSYSTVSRCLNSCPNVSAVTKQKVEEEAERLGFCFNVNARNLVKKKTSRIGVIFSDDYNREDDSRRFFGDAMEAAIRAIESNKYDFVIQPNHSILGESNILRMVSGQNVDGLIIASKDISEKEYNFLVNNNFPHVFIFFKPKFIDEKKNNFFWDDNVYGGYIATKYLIDKGHRDILSITSVQKDSNIYYDRTRGYIDAMNDAGLNPKLISTEIDFKSQQEFVAKNIDELKKYTAIFVQQDVPAVSISQELKLVHGVRIPEEMSIISYNNIELIDYFKAGLTTIDDKRQIVIQNAVDCLVDRVEKLDVDDYERVQRPSIIERTSVEALNELEKAVND
ncbi:MAG: LacI family transcriptional regulator [Clostridioides sp.]|jgi:DNA-binding LacI/PurR family transcriptional regulator|nr:LacI family transcriptional regulator [Clostridioides sp.]